MQPSNFTTRLDDDTSTTSDTSSTPASSTTSSEYSDEEESDSDEEETDSENENDSDSDSDSDDSSFDSMEQSAEQHGGPSASAEPFATAPAERSSMLDTSMINASRMGDSAPKEVVITQVTPAPITDLESDSDSSREDSDSDHSDSDDSSVSLSQKPTQQQGGPFASNDAEAPSFVTAQAENNIVQDASAINSSKMIDSAPEEVMLAQEPLAPKSDLGSSRMKPSTMIDSAPKEMMVAQEPLAPTTDLESDSDSCYSSSDEESTTIDEDGKEANHKALKVPLIDPNQQQNQQELPVLAEQPQQTANHDDEKDNVVVAELVPAATHVSAYTYEQQQAPPLDQAAAAGPLLSSKYEPTPFPNKDNESNETEMCSDDEIAVAIDFYEAAMENEDDERAKFLEPPQQEPQRQPLQQEPVDGLMSMKVLEYDEEEGHESFAYQTYQPVAAADDATIDLAKPPSKPCTCTKSYWAFIALLIIAIAGVTGGCVYYFNSRSEPEFVSGESSSVPSSPPSFSVAPTHTNATTIPRPTVSPNNPDSNSPSAMPSIPKTITAQPITDSKTASPTAPSTSSPTTHPGIENTSSPTSSNSLSTLSPTALSTNIASSSSTQTSSSNTMDPSIISTMDPSFMNNTMDPSFMNNTMDPSPSPTNFSGTTTLTPTFMSSSSLSPSTWAQQGMFEGPQAGLSTTFSDNGNLIAYAENNGTYGIVHIQTINAGQLSQNWVIDSAQDVINTQASSSPFFGNSISLSGDGTRLAIGDPGYNSTGRVSVFQYSATDSQWIQVGSSLIGESVGDKQGFSVSLSDDGSRIAVGVVGSHCVKIFQYNDPDWDLVGDDISSSSNDDGTGYSVSISANGTKVAIGSPNSTSNGSSESGLVGIYEEQTGNVSSWKLVGNTISGSIEKARLGVSVSISSDGNRVAIGSDTYDGSNVLDGGQCQVFEYKNDAGDWSRLGSSIDGDLQGRDYGHLVSLSGNGQRVAFASKYGNSNGIVRVHEFSVNDWLEIGLSLKGENENDDFGTSVVLNFDGNLLGVGAPGADRMYIYSYANVSDE